jgi:DNA-binding FadR family transcriptional regulator
MQTLSLRRHSLVDEVGERLRLLIAERGLASGARMPTEGQLVRELGVSRNVLREAIRRLSTCRSSAPASPGRRK